ncbi:MAG: DUF502 domain-containing protein [Planctomycetes bacterium]|nr:DUF502 domain-containing protein [Planctomycetota bacterium]
MKGLFARGLIALLPMAVTILVIYFVISFLYTYVGMPLGDTMRWGLARITGQSPEELMRISWFYRSGAPFLGLLLGIVIVFFVGAAVATFFGKKLLQLFERLLARTPVIGVIYPYAKQFTEFFSPGKKPEFKNAVAIPFPCYGVYSIGFITGEGLRHLNEAARKPMVTVFVPTAPTPFTGFVCWVPREDVVPLPITADEALRIIISCGVLTPAHQAVSLTDFAAAAAREGKTLPPPPPPHT